MASPPRKKGRFALMNADELSGAAKKRLWSTMMEEDENRRAQPDQAASKSSFPALGVEKTASKDSGKFIKISAKQPDVKIATKSAILVGKFLDSIFPGRQLERKTNDGGILVKTRDKTQAEPDRLAKIGKFHDIDVEIRLLNSMNKSTGRIYAEELIGDKVEDILESLKAYGATNVKRIVRTEDGGHEKPTPILLVDFDSPQRPNKVKIGWQIYNVRTHYPKVRQCLNCWHFGHWKDQCKQQQARCRQCSAILEQDHQCLMTKCANCPNGENDHPNDMSCPSFEIESAIRKIRTDENVSHATAERILKRRMKELQQPIGQAYANAAKSQPTPSAPPMPPTEVKEREGDLVRRRMEVSAQIACIQAAYEALVEEEKKLDEIIEKFEQKKRTVEGKRRKIEELLRGVQSGDDDDENDQLKRKKLLAPEIDEIAAPGTEHTEMTTAMYEELSQSTKQVIYGTDMRLKEQGKYCKWYFDADGRIYFLPVDLGGSGSSEFLLQDGTG